MRGVFDGARKEGSQRSGGCPPAAGCGSGVAAADAVAWSARAVACGAARVLAVNRGRCNDRGRSRRGGCVDAGGVQMVPPRWWDVADQPGRAHRSPPVVPLVGGVIVHDQVELDRPTVFLDVSGVVAGDLFEDSRRRSRPSSQLLMVTTDGSARTARCSTVRRSWNPGCQGASRMPDPDPPSRDEVAAVRLPANFAGPLRDMLEWIRYQSVIVPGDFPPDTLKAAAALAAGVLRDCPQRGDNRPTVPSDNRIGELQHLLSAHWRVPLHKPSPGEDVVFDARAAQLASVL